MMVPQARLWCLRLFSCLVVVVVDIIFVVFTVVVAVHIGFSSG